jgi:hypothetical protein
MSLRTDIKDAIDDVTPPALGLENRVRAIVLADGKERRVSVGRRSPWNIRFRGMGALAAAALVVVLIAGFVIGGRVWRDWGNGNLGQAASINQPGLHNLEAKPLLLPVLQPGAACPFTPDPAQSAGLGGSMMGTGPVYLLYVNASIGMTARGDWFEVALGYVAKGPGQVLVRARDLSTGKLFGFTQIWVGLNGATAAGPVLGTEQLNGETIQVHPEAVLHDPAQLVNKQGITTPLIVWFAMPRATLCWGLQFDGPGFSETYVNGWDTAADKAGMFGP